MTWQPRPLPVLLADIELSENQMDEVSLKWWNMIKIEPVKWTMSPWGDLGGGFWVVGILGQRCLFHNDIEEGFGWGKFTEYGRIDEYHANQSALAEVIGGLPW